MRYEVQANVGGKIAQLGSRLIDGVAKKMADKFFTNFVALAADGGAQAGVGSEAVPRRSSRQSPNTSWFRRISEWFMSR